MFYLLMLCKNIVEAGYLQGLKGKTIIWNDEQKVFYSSFYKRSFPANILNIQKEHFNPKLSALFEEKWRQRQSIREDLGTLITICRCSQIVAIVWDMYFSNKKNTHFSHLFFLVFVPLLLVPQPLSSPAHSFPLPCSAPILLYPYLPLFESLWLTPSL